MPASLPTLLGDRVLLELPRNYGLDGGDNLRTATVLAVGTGSGGNAAAAGVSDVVAFHARDALRLSLAGTDYLIVKRPDVAAIVERNAPPAAAAAPAPASAPAPAPSSSPSRK